MSIKILLTGGTIDKHYYESTGELGFVETYIPEILKLGRNRSDVDVQKVMLKDSLAMDDNDRTVIQAFCENAIQDKIVITHGTDTMVKTARVIADSNLSKTIVLVGAMVPFVFKHSDAVFNMGFAMAAVQTLPQGVYVAMNGRIFDWDKVIKNTALGVFEDI